MSNNILNDISSVYVKEVLEPKIEAGGGGKKVEKGGTSEEASAKRVRQAVYDIRYRAKREGIELEQAFSQYSGKSSMTGQEKTAVKEKLGISEEVQVVHEEGEKFQVRVRDKESGKTYVRYATRDKIAQLRSNPNISSVEMTKYGKPYEGEKERGEYTSKVKSGKGLDPVGREDKDIDNDGDHDKTDKYLLNRRKVRGKAIATRKEGVEVPDKNLKSLVSKASKRIDADVDGDVDKDDPKEKGMGEFVPSADGKKKLGTKVKTESFYSWRDSLVEVADEMDSKNKKVKEKKIKNKIKINPSLGESIEKMGGEIIESEEFYGVFDDIVDVDFYHISEELIENVLIEFYEEILEEGYDLLEVRKAIVESINIEMALLDEAAVTYGHDTDTKGLKKTKMDSMKSAVKKAYTKGKQAYDSPTGKRVRKKVKRGLYRIAKRVSNVADKAAQRLMDVGEAVSQMPGRETNPPKGTTGKQDDVQRKQMLAAKERVMKRQQMLDRERLQMQKSGKLPSGHAYEEVDYEESDSIEEKALSKAQQRFMGMVHATKKGDMPAPSAEVAKAAASMTGKEAKDFAKTKHKGLPEKKVKKEEMEVDEATRYAKETGKSFKSGKERVEGGSMKDDKAFQSVSKMMRSMQGKPAGQRKKVPGKKPPTAGQYGGPKSPAQKVASRRASAQRAQNNMSSRFD